MRRASSRSVTAFFRRVASKADARRANRLGALVVALVVLPRAISPLTRITSPSPPYGLVRVQPSDAPRREPTLSRRAEKRRRLNLWTAHEAG